MKRCQLLLAFVIGFAGVAPLPAAEPVVERAAGNSKPSAQIVGRRIPNFVLSTADGKQAGLADFGDKQFLMVVFLGTECPIGNAFVPVLRDLEQQYREKKVGVVAINASPGDTPEAIEKHVEDYDVTFPVLVDTRQETVSLFGAKRLSEVFLLDARRTVRYHGRIDDRFGYDYKRDEPSRHDLKQALDELLAEKPVSVAETETAGCLITLRAQQKKKGEVTYSSHVAGILKKNCADCHHPGTAAPFSLLTYNDAANWSEMLREVVVQRRMPPWHADPRHGKFANERRLTQDDVDTLAAWVESGSPEGEKQSDAPQAEYEAGWRIGKPDAVFQMPKDFTVPAQGTVGYKYFTTKTNFTEDVWVQAAEARPGNAAVVHHIIVFYQNPKNPLDKVWIASTAPGAEPVKFPAGMGRKIPAGAELIWQMHYTPNGKETTDRSELGLVFCKEPPKYNVKNYGIANVLLNIPPGMSDHEVVSSVPVFKDAVVLSLYPHMHVRGKSFTYEAIFPDGRKELLLSIPQYDFNWQNTYRFETPLRLPKGATIRCVAHYDNSAANPANPDPKKTVRWGDQTWNEMMIGYVDFYYEDEKVAERTAQK